MTTQEPIRATVDRFDNGVAVLVFDDDLALGRHAGQTLTVPRRTLPRGVHEGDVILFEPLTSQQSTENREQVARKLLEDILNGK